MQDQPLLFASWAFGQGDRQGGASLIFSFERAQGLVCASTQEERGPWWLWLPWLSCPSDSSVCVGSFPAGQRGRVRSIELGTSRVVGKQGERGETKISAGQTKL